MDPVSLALGLLVLVGAFKVGVKATADGYATVKAASSGQFDFIEADRQRRASQREKLAAAWAERRKARAKEAGDEAGDYRPGVKAYATDLYHGFWEDRLDHRGKRRAARPEWQPNGTPWQLRVRGAVQAKAERLREVRAGDKAKAVGQWFIHGKQPKPEQPEPVESSEPADAANPAPVSPTPPTTAEPEPPVAPAQQDPADGRVENVNLARTFAVYEDEGRNVAGRRPAGGTGQPDRHEVPADDDCLPPVDREDRWVRRTAGKCAFLFPRAASIGGSIPAREFCDYDAEPGEDFCHRHRGGVEGAAPTFTVPEGIPGDVLMARRMAGRCAYRLDDEQAGLYGKTEYCDEVNDDGDYVYCRRHRDLVNQHQQADSQSPTPEVPEPNEGDTTMTTPTTTATAAGDVHNNEDARRVFEAQIAAAAEASEALAVYEAAQRKLDVAATSGLDGLNGRRFDVQAQAAQANAADLLPASDMSQADAAIEGIRAAAESGLQALEKYRDSEDLVNSNNVDGRTLETAQSA